MKKSTPNPGLTAAARAIETERRLAAMMAPKWAELEGAELRAADAEMREVDYRSFLGAMVEAWYPSAVAAPSPLLVAEVGAREIQRVKLELERRQATALRCRAEAHEVHRRTLVDQRLASQIVFDELEREARASPAAVDKIASKPSRQSALIRRRSAERPIVHARHAFDLLQLFVDKRIANEELGDPLEVIERLVAEGRPSWQVYVKVFTTIFWVVYNAFRGR